MIKVGPLLVLQTGYFRTACHFETFFFHKLKLKEHQTDLTY